MIPFQNAASALLDTLSTQYWLSPMGLSSILSIKAAKSSTVTALTNTTIEPGSRCRTMSLRRLRSLCGYVCHTERQPQTSRFRFFLLFTGPFSMRFFSMLLCMLCILSASLAYPSKMPSILCE